MPAIRVVRDGDFVGVVAEDPLIAEEVLSAIQAKWNVPPQVSNRELFDYLRNNPDSAGAGPQHNSGSVAASACDGRRRREDGATLHSPVHRSCAPLEPRAAVAEVEWRQALRSGLERSVHSACATNWLGDVPYSCDQSPGHHARHGQWLWRQAHRRMCCRGSAPRESRREAGKRWCDDTRRRVLPGPTSGQQDGSKSAAACCTMGRL